MLGTFRNDKIINEFHIANKDYVSRNLTSSPKNWNNIISDLENNNFSGVVFNITEAVLMILTNPTYSLLWIKLLECTSKYSNLIFLYEDTLKRKYNIFYKSYYVKYFYYQEFNSEPSKFMKLMSNYFIDRLMILSDIITDYYNNFILKYSVSASNEEWNELAQSFTYSMQSELMTLDYMLYDSTPRGQHNYDNKDIQIQTHKLQSTINSLLENMKKLRLYEANSNKFKTLDLNLLNKYTLFNEYYNEQKFLLDEKIISTAQKMDEIVETVLKSNSTVTPYKHVIDIVNSIRTFLSDSEQDIVFKKYVYKNEAYAYEFEKFLSLFQEYIFKVKK